MKEEMGAEYGRTDLLDYWNLRFTFLKQEDSSLLYLCDLLQVAGYTLF